jgi:hypothetical protein
MPNGNLLPTFKTQHAPFSHWSVVKYTWPNTTTIVTISLRFCLLDLQSGGVQYWDTPKIVGLDYKLQQSLPREYIPYCTVVDIEIESPKRDCIRQAYFFMDTHDITIILNPLSSLGTCVLSIIYLLFLLHLRHVWQ